MDLQLSATEESLKEQFYSLKDAQDVAEILEIEYKDLNYYVYRFQESKRYSTLQIRKKSGGYRTLLIPNDSLKILQSKLNRILQSVYVPRASVHGFVPGRGIMTNVNAHYKYSRRSYILNIDLENFFPSINFGRVRGLFMAPPYSLPDKAATVLAQICCYDNQLPQGAPTSPVISNMICAKLDTQLQHLAEKNKCVYTRYADDITFSTSLPKFPRALAFIEHEATGPQLVLGNGISHIVETNGFTINQQKVHLRNPSQQQLITGIKVNKLPNLPRSYINQVRAMLHAWEKRGLEVAQQDHFARWSAKHRATFLRTPSYKSIVRGKIQYLGMIKGVEDPVYRRFRAKFEELSKDMEIAIMMPTRDKIFVSYSHKDKKWFDDFMEHMSPRQRADQNLDIWSDTRLKPGMDWFAEITEALNSAKVAVLIVSKHFLSSNFIQEYELPKLLDAAENEGVKILWFLVGNCAVDATTIPKYHALHVKALAEYKVAQRDKVLRDICKEISEA